MTEKNKALKNASKKGGFLKETKCIIRNCKPKVDGRFIMMTVHVILKVLVNLAASKCTKT